VGAGVAASSWVSRADLSPGFERKAQAPATRRAASATEAEQGLSRWDRLSRREMRR
jgi:hypothetical protein